MNRIALAAMLLTAFCDRDSCADRAAFHGFGAKDVDELFRRRHESRERLPPMQLDADLTAGIGYGFRYTFSRDMQITLVEEGFLTVHQRTNVAGNENTIGRHFVLRLGTRFGF